MTTDQLRRVAGTAGLAAAVLGVPADLYHFTFSSRTAAATTAVFPVHGIVLIVAFCLLLLALMGLVLAQQDRAGRLGLVGAGLAFLGGVLAIGDLMNETFALPLAPGALGDATGLFLAMLVLSFGCLAAGWLLTALALRRAGLLSVRATWLLGIGAVLAFPPIPGAYLTLLLGAALATRALRRPASAPAVEPVAAAT